MKPTRVDTCTMLGTMGMVCVFAFAAYAEGPGTAVPQIQASDTLQAPTPDAPASGAQSPVRPAVGEQPPAAAIDVDATLQMARDLLHSADYDSTIKLLEPVLEATRFNPDRLRDTYLLLIEAHVYSGNASEAGSKDQDLWYDAARRLIEECLAVSALRHTRPDPPESYPSKMVQLFDDARREMFGSFEITHLDPVDAEVTIDGERLARDSDGKWRADDVPIGTRMLVIRHPKCQDFTADVLIEAAITKSEPYTLRRKKGWGWYSTWIAAPVVAVGTAVAFIVGGGNEETPAPEPLPGPPGPPSKSLSRP